MNGARSSSATNATPRADRPGVDHHALAGSEDLHVDQGGEQGDGQQVRDPLDHGALEDRGGTDSPASLSR